MHDVGDFMNVIEGNIASPAGFRASGIHAGLKKSRKDMALIVSECPAVSAAAFTTNRVKAAPVLYDMKILEKGLCPCCCCEQRKCECLYRRAGLQRL